MTYTVGEFVPSDRAEMGESTLPLELFLSCWNPKKIAGVSRGTQWTGRDVKAKEIRQVQRSRIWDSIIAQGGNFVIDSLSYSKPVQFSQKRWNVCAFGGFENESSRTILNLLKFVNQLLRYPWQQGITVIKAWQNQGYHKGFGSINYEDMSNWANSTQFQVKVQFQNLIQNEKVWKVGLQDGRFVYGVLLTNVKDFKMTLHDVPWAWYGLKISEWTKKLGYTLPCRHNTREKKKTRTIDKIFIFSIQTTRQVISERKKTDILLRMQICQARLDLL